MPKATYVIDFDGTTLCRPDDLSQAGYPDHDSEPVRAAINALTASAFTLAQRCGITVCICSGNILASILPHVTRHGFAPDLIACKIGTELWQRQVDGRYRQDAAHRKRMCANFDAVRIAQTVTAFFQTRGVHVTPHAAVMNGPGKTSCHIALTAGRALPDLSPLATALQTQGFYVMLACSLITEKHERDAFHALGFAPDHVWNFDIVHGAAGKDKVAEAIFSRHSSDHHVVAGDGGNDAPLLQSAGVHKAIVVGNAAADLRRTAESVPQAFISLLPAGLALVESLLQDGHVQWDALPAGTLASLPEPLRTGLATAAHRWHAALLPG